MSVKNINSARAAYYRFLSSIFASELTENALKALKDFAFTSDAGSPVIKEGLKRLKKFSANTPNIDEIAADYAKIFLAAGQAEGKAAFPYESVYTSREKLLMQDSWEQVRKFYASKGLALETAHADIKEDHISSELECMAWLAENGTDQEALNFLETHLLNWVGKFSDDVNKYAEYDIYPAAAKITLGFLELEREFLQDRINNKISDEKISSQDTKSYSLSVKDMDSVISKWKNDYRIFAPVLQAKRGSSKPVVRYSEINSVSEICTDRTSDFSAKEIYYPIMQTMFYFTESDVSESSLNDERDIIVFLHPCDINALRRTDNIFLKNGSKSDMFYERLRNKIRIVLLECGQSFDNCFCVSMNSNKADNYEMAFRIKDDGVKVQVKNLKWDNYFKSFSPCNFAPEFVSANERKVSTPEINNAEELKTASTLKFWDSFNDDCISCGGCNTVCPTCSCFDTNDIIYSELSRDGERRRVWSSCMLDTFTLTAGGARARTTPGANMRFKTLHKAYDYQKRFGEGENMCVGCGRCIIRCPKEIDFSKTLNDFTREFEKAKEAMN